MRDYFRDKVVNNLKWLDQYAAGLATPLGTLFPGRRPEDEQWAPYSWIALWEQIYVAWAVDHAQQHGFGPRRRPARPHRQAATSPLHE